jgi:hypothetical protein
LANHSTNDGDACINEAGLEANKRRSDFPPESPAKKIRASIGLEQKEEQQLVNDNQNQPLQVAETDEKGHGSPAPRRWGRKRKMIKRLMRGKTAVDKKAAVVSVGKTGLEMKRKPGRPPKIKASDTLPREPFEDDIVTPGESSSLDQPSLEQEQAKKENLMKSQDSCPGEKCWQCCGSGRSFCPDPDSE